MFVYLFYKIYAWHLFVMNQPRFHGMSCLGFVAVSRIAGRPVSSKSYWVRRPSTVQRTVTQLHRVDDQKAGANGRSRGYLNSVHLISYTAVWSCFQVSKHILRYRWQAILMFVCWSMVIPMRNFFLKLRARTWKCYLEDDRVLFGPRSRLSGSLPSF